MTSALHQRPCQGCHDGIPLSPREIDELFPQLLGWVIENNRLIKVYAFRNFHDTMAFVNAIAWITHRVDHHPTLLVQYNQCQVEYWTHSARGLTQNDFICAALVDQLLVRPGEG